MSEIQELQRKKPHMQIVDWKICGRNSLFLLERKIGKDERENHVYFINYLKNSTNFFWRLYIMKTLLTRENYYYKYTAFDAEVDKE